MADYKRHLHISSQEELCTFRVPPRVQSRCTGGRVRVCETTMLGRSVDDKVGRDVCYSDLCSDMRSESALRQVTHVVHCVLRSQLYFGFSFSNYRALFPLQIGQFANHRTKSPHQNRRTSPCPISLTMRTRRFTWSSNTFRNMIGRFECVCIEDGLSS